MTLPISSAKARVLDALTPNEQAELSDLVLAKLVSVVLLAYADGELLATREATAHIHRRLEAGDVPDVPSTTGNRQ